jgi:hypothetical protein
MHSSGKRLLYQLHQLIAHQRQPGVVTTAVGCCYLESAQQLCQAGGTSARVPPSALVCHTRLAVASICIMFYHHYNSPYQSSALLRRYRLQWLNLKPCLSQLWPKHSSIANHHHDLLSWMQVSCCCCHYLLRCYGLHTVTVGEQEVLQQTLGINGSVTGCALMASSQLGQQLLPYKRSCCLTSACLVAWHSLYGTDGELQ